ncbi:MAG TPA: gliding motility protein GldM [Ferruginibacter sp.]|nr:gliding motility protein GldM [Ferruginibacter sp.]
MALPREPRQKMINIMYLVLTAILALNVSAEVIEAFKTVDKSLQGSSENINTANSILYSSLESKLKDEQYKAQAEKWQPKGLDAKRYSDEVIKYIEDLKLQLKQNAGLKEDGSFKEDNLDASTRLFETSGKGDELKAKLDDYKKKMLSIDSSFGKLFAANFPVNTDPIPSKEGGTKPFTAGYFHMTPTVAALTMLSKFQNNVKNAENTITSHIHSQIGAVKFVYDKFAAVVGQSSNYVMPGEKVIVTAGVGAYSLAAQPQITIGGASVPVNADGVAIKEFNADGGGERSIPVTVTYTKPDGSKESKTFPIKYTVGTPGGAAVMLDKMNVFYIGVDNPVTIGSPTGWDKTSVSMTGGTISGGTTNRTVRVTTVGPATITVTADGKSKSFPFRVKRIPDPIIKVGPSGGGRLQAVVFRNQQFVRADLENFDFEAKFAVTGATVYFNIPGDRNVNSVTLTSGNLGSAKSLMDKLVPGSTVTFDNIRVVGPDGQTRTIQNPPGFSLF